MHHYTSQEVGFMLISFGTILALPVLAWGIGYIIWMFIPVNVPVNPEPPKTAAPTRPVPVVPTKKMSPQRSPYAARHARVAPKVVEETRLVHPGMRNLRPAVDPWVNTANTEIR
jgi:hypothetical protein